MESAHVAAAVAVAEAVSENMHHFGLGYTDFLR